MARVTLTDVAKDAGVSRATASIVLNDSPLIAQATKERVRESFSRLGYVYDRAAASLRKNQSLAVGLVITQLSNPYFAEFVEGIQSELDDRGMDVLLGISAEDRARQRRLLVSMSERRVDGVVVIPAHQSEPADFAGLHMPIVMLARRVKGFDTDYVGGDNYAGSVAATNHLLVAHGERVGRPSSADTSTLRRVRSVSADFCPWWGPCASGCRCEISRRVCRTGSWPAALRPN